MDLCVWCELKFYEKHVVGPFGIVVCVEQNTERKINEKYNDKWTISTHRGVKFLQILACLEANELLHLM